MRRAYSFILISLFSFILSGCSLLKLQLEDNSQPLSQDQLAMRIFTREYASTFFAGVEQSADYIMAQGTKEQKTYALLWKISAEQTLGETIFQASPITAMIDTWAFTAQMADFFQDGKGKDLFGEHSALAAKTSQQLLDDYERRMKGVLPAVEFTSAKAFIEQYIAQHQLFDITFPRVSAFNDWLKYRGISEQQAVTSIGNVPEVLTDMSDRVSILVAQTPKLLGWKAELFALHADVDAKDIQGTLTDIQSAAIELEKFAIQSPALIMNFSKNLQRDIEPLLAQLDKSAADSLMQLGLEREALTKMISSERIAIAEIVERERIALEAMVNKERQAITQDVDELVATTVEQVFAEITKTVKALIIYIILLLLVVFFAPLLLGVWLGKRMALKNAMKA